MKNTLLSIVAIAALTGVTNAQLYTASTFSDWTSITDGFTANVKTAGVVVGTATLRYSAVTGFDTPTAGSGVGAAVATLTSTGSPDPARLRWNFRVTAAAGYQVDGVSFFSQATELANPTLALINTTGGVPAPGTSGNIILLEGANDFFSNGVNGQVNPGTLTANTGTGINGWAPADHEDWSLNTSSNALNLTYIADTSVSNLSAEGLRFDTSISPVPEPSSVALLGFGVLGLISRRKRA